MIAKDFLDASDVIKAGIPQIKNKVAITHEKTTWGELHFGDIFVDENLDILVQVATTPLRRISYVGNEVASDKTIIPAKYLDGLKYLEDYENNSNDPVVRVRLYFL